MRHVRIPYEWCSPQELLSKESKLFCKNGETVVISEAPLDIPYLKQQIKGHRIWAGFVYEWASMRKGIFPFRTISGFHALPFAVCASEKAPFQKFISFWKSASETVFSILIYDLISRRSIRRLAVLSPLFGDSAPRSYQVGSMSNLRLFQDRSDGSGLRTGRRARSKPSTVHPSQSSEVPDRSIVLAREAVFLSRNSSLADDGLQNLCDVQMPESGTDLLSNPKHFSDPARYFTGPRVTGI